jgi:hypothetical protein
MLLTLFPIRTQTHCAIWSHPCHAPRNTTRRVTPVTPRNQSGLLGVCSRLRSVPGAVATG